MPDYDYDAIVVGAGCAGSIAAYELANAGKSVLLVERGESAGSKNMTGGRIYVHSLARVFPDEWKDAPLERRITHERISLMSANNAMTVDYASDRMRVDGSDSYSVLRGPLDQWLCEKAEDAGADVICDTVVEGLVKDGMTVCGIRAGEDELSARVVVLCDGANSLLSAEAVGAHRPAPSEIAVGIKETFALPAGVISDRAGTSSDDEGCAWMMAGDATKGVFGGGFAYTNKESISLGVVAGIGATVSGDTPIYGMLEELKAHPAIAPLIEGGELVEHSGHMVPEGGFNAMPTLVGDGVLLAGDNAMMCINHGYSVRGMDYAVAAGQAAGRAAAAAIDAGDTSAAGLSAYTRALDGSFVMKDLRSFSGAPAFMENFTRMFRDYPEMVGRIMDPMFVVDGSPSRHVGEIAKPEMKRIGYMNLLRDGRGAMKEL